MPNPAPEPAAQQAARLLRERVRSLFARLPQALAGDKEAVHQLRVAGRRLRVALPLLARKPGGKRVRRATRSLRRLVRTAGLSRDLDVGLALFEKRLAEPPVSAEARRLRQLLRATRTRGHGRMVDALLEEEIPGLRRDLRRIQARGADGFFPVLQRLRGSVASQGERLRHTLSSVGTCYDPDALHSARIQARRLRYTAEVANRLGFGAEGAAERFKRLQSLLGAVQDAHVLAERLAALGDRAQARGQAALAAEARDQALYFRELSRAHHGELVAADPLGIVRDGLETLARRRSAA